MIWVFGIWFVVWQITAPMIGAALIVRMRNRNGHIDSFDRNQSIVGGYVFGLFPPIFLIVAGITLARRAITTMVDYYTEVFEAHGIKPQFKPRLGRLRDRRAA